MSHAFAAARICAALLVFDGISGCSDDSDLRIVGKGRYVELAANRDEPVCGGTIAFFDRFIEAGFALIGETPPDRVFVRYEWVKEDPERTSITGVGFARIEGDDVRIRMDQLIQEHELAHAIHLQAWPTSARFLHEGFAVLLNPRRPFVERNPWPDSVPLDEVLGSADLDVHDYYYAWFLVSQIMVDHGIAGLRDLWHAIPRGATAQEVRDAYQSLFHRPIDALIQPWIFESDNPDQDGQGIPRYPCNFALCTGQSKPWDGDVWSASGPTDCEDDPDAIGPYEGVVGLLGGRPVWRDYVFEPDDRPYERDPIIDPLAVQALSCQFECVQPTPYFFGQGSAPEEPWQIDKRRRIQVHGALEDLPTDTPTEVIYRYTEG
jgi:hypothetical protein